MRSVILTAGKATRAGHYAPDGCKALVPLDGRPVLEWQLDVLGGDPLIVCRSEHAPLLEKYGEVVTNDACRGAGDALNSALRVVDEPIVVAYADTYFDAIPDGTDWVGVSEAKGGRRWYVILDLHDGRSWVVYRDVPADQEVTVGVGLFAFSDVDRLRDITSKFGTEHLWRGTEWGLDVVLNRYRCWTPVPIPSWRDVGDADAIERWNAA